MRILLIEDHKDTAICFCRLLEMKGHEVASAESIADARSLAGSGAFDLFLCDLTLPDGDGFELAALAHNCGAKAIAVTAHGMPEARARCDHAGFDGYLLKPVEFEQMFATIAEVCGK